ncbi:MAG: VCBS repeat-containing protein [Rhizomicrobium sp.]
MQTVADLDGDGCADIVGGIDPSTLVLEYSCSPAVTNYSTNAVHFAYMAPDGEYIQVPPIIGDFNGDGKADLIDYTGQIFLSTGTGLVYAGMAPFNSNGGALAADFNGDGKSDLVVLSADNSSLLVYLSTGSEFVLAATIPVSGSVTSLTQLVIADWNNDGAQDIWYQPPSGDDQEILFTYTPELMTSVTNGLNASTSVTYGGERPVGVHKGHRRDLSDRGHDRRPICRLKIPVERWHRRQLRDRLHLCRCQAGPFGPRLPRLHAGHRDGPAAPRCRDHGLPHGFSVCR